MSRKLGLMLGCVALTAAPNALAQFVAPAAITLTGGGYTQDWGTTSFSTLPTGFTGGAYKSGSISSVSEAEAVVFDDNEIPKAVSFGFQLSQDGDLYGYANGGNAMVALTSSPNSQTGIHALVMGLDTTGLTQVDLSYDLVVANADSNYRGAGIVVQYRVGNTGTWTTIDDSYYIAKSTSPPANGTVTSYDFNLATGALDQPLVEIRWQGYQQAIAGQFTSIGIDNIAVTAVPEPASYALLVGLLVLTGVVVGRRGRCSAGESSV